MAINDLAGFLFGLAHRNVFLDATVVFFARYVPYLLGLTFIAFLLSEQGYRRRLFLILETALALLLSRGIIAGGIHFFYPALRPFEALGIAPLVHAAGSAFPSGHASVLFAGATILLFHNRRWGWWFMVFALMNGVSRVAAGVHWPTDIIGGALMGIISATAIHFSLRHASRALQIQNVRPSAPPSPAAIETEQKESGA